MKKQPKTRVRILLFSARVTAYDRNEAYIKARKALFEKNINLINDTFQIEVREIGACLFVCDVLNCYFVEQLSFFDSIRNLIRILNAATFNIGIAPPVVVIE